MNTINYTLTYPNLFTTDAKVEKRMANYIRETTPNVSEADMITLVTEGEEIARRIFEPRFDPAKTPPTKDQAVALMWYLMAKAAKQEQEYERGVIVCTDPDADRVFDFLLRCGEQDHEVHVHDRISSHFKNRIEGLQYGIDILKGTTKFPLPVNMQAILFAKLIGGGVFIKMEQLGFPVKAWLKAMTGDPKYRHFKAYAPKVFMGHGKNWGKHILAGPDESSPLPTRRESKKLADIDDVNASFKKSMKALRATEEEIAEAIKEGPDHMERVLEMKMQGNSENSDDEEEGSPIMAKLKQVQLDSPKVLKAHNTFKTRVQELKETEKGYSGGIKRQGSEVMLPVNPNFRPPSSKENTLL